MWTTFDRPSTAVIGDFCAKHATTSPPPSSSRAAHLQACVAEAYPWIRGNSASILNLYVQVAPFVGVAGREAGGVEKDIRSTYIHAYTKQKRTVGKRSAVRTKFVLRYIWGRGTTFRVAGHRRRLFRGLRGNATLMLECYTTCSCSRALLPR